MVQIQIRWTLNLRHLCNLRIVFLLRALRVSAVTLVRLRPVLDRGDAHLASAVGAAEDLAVGLDAVADDPAVAVGAAGARAWIAHSKLSNVWAFPSVIVTWNDLS